MHKKQKDMEALETLWVSVSYCGYSGRLIGSFRFPN